ncbi:MAG: hypothetical protein Q8L64_07030 [bacterium]|nr:hypothetical protein [bacterium]
MPTHSEIETKAHIFDNAKRVCALHRAIVQIENIPDFAEQKALLVSEMERAAKEFHSLGGIIETGTDSLGMKGPILRYPDNEVIDYDIGRIASEKSLTALKSPNPAVHTDAAR